jgi:hypothetical protein
VGAWLALIAVSMSGSVADATIEEQVAASELIIEAEIVARSSRSVVLKVVEVIKGTPRNDRLTVELGSDFHCDVSSDVPSRGRGLWLLQQRRGAWVIVHWGRAFYERSTGSDGADVALAMGGVIVPRAWLIARDAKLQRTRLDWNALVGAVRRAVAPTPRYSDAKWTRRTYDCSRCDLAQVVRDLTDGGSVDYGWSDSSGAQNWMRDRLVGSHKRGRAAHATFGPQRYDRFQSSTESLWVLQADGGVLLGVSTREPSAEVRGCILNRLEWSSCGEGSIPGERCAEPTRAGTCAGSPELLSDVPLDPTDSFSRGRRLGDWSESGVCFSVDETTTCVPDKVEKQDFIVTSWSG